MRLIVARCEVRYTGRANTVLPMATRLLMIQPSGGVSIWADSGSPVKPQNWMTPPTIVEFDGEPVERIEVRKVGADDQLAITVEEIISDVTHDMGEAAALEKDGVEADLQIALADAPHFCGEGLRLVRREWPTDIGPVDLMCRDEDDGWVAVEIKRIGTIDAVEQLSRYLERMREDPVLANCRGVLVATRIAPQAKVLATSRGIDWAEVDLEVVRGEREAALTLFG